MGVCGPSRASVVAVVKSFVFEASDRARFGDCVQTVPRLSSTTTSPLAVPPPLSRARRIASHLALAAPAGAAANSRAQSAARTTKGVSARLIGYSNTQVSQGSGVSGVPGRGTGTAVAPGILVFYGQSRRHRGQVPAQTRQRPQTSLEDRARARRRRLYRRRLRDRRPPRP